MHKGSETLQDIDDPLRRNKKVIQMWNYQTQKLFPSLLFFLLAKYFIFSFFIASGKKIRNDKKNQQ